jgi:hypothetical protein
MKAYRWRLHNKLNMRTLIHLVNGKLKHPTKQVQLANVCNALGLSPIFSTKIYTQNPWFSGFSMQKALLIATTRTTNYLYLLAKKIKLFWIIFLVPLK